MGEIGWAVGRIREAVGEIWWVVGRTGAAAVLESGT